MLKSIEIVNFQSVKNLKMDLNYPVVVITGASDSGKSAILRAVNNAIFEGVGGAYFRKELKDDKPVTLKEMRVRVVSDTGIVEWIKSKTDATYIINDTDKRENCGKVVPLEVPKVLGLTSADAVGENLHYRNQFQSAFLLNDRGPKDAYRFISTLMGADIVIQASGFFEKNARELAKEVKTATGSLEMAQESLDNYYTEGDLRSMDNALLALQEKEKLIGVLKQKLSDIDAVASVVSDFNILSYSLESKQKSLNGFTVLVGSLEEKYNKLVLKESLLSDISAVLICEQSLSGISQRLALSKPVVSFDMAGVLSAYDSLQVLISKQAVLDGLVAVSNAFAKIEIHEISPIDGLLQKYETYAALSKRLSDLDSLVSSSVRFNQVAFDLTLNEGIVLSLKDKLPQMSSGHFNIVSDSGTIEVIGSVFMSDNSIVKLERLGDE